MSELPFKRISVIGLGYIGLPTAAMFASRTIEVVGVDVNEHAVDTINRGEVHIVDLRETPALQIASEIASKHVGPITIIEQHTSALPAALQRPNVYLEQDPNRADINILLVDHKAFRDMNIRAGCIIDTRGIWN